MKGIYKFLIAIIKGNGVFSSGSKCRHKKINPPEASSVGGEKNVGLGGKGCWSYEKKDKNWRRSVMKNI